MNFWQIVMLMAWFAVFALYVWAIIAVLIDVVRREDVSGVGTVGWIVVLIVVPVIGILVYIAVRPTLSRDEARDVEHYEAAVVSDPTAASQIAELARLHAEGAIDDDEYRDLKAKVIN